MYRKPFFRCGFVGRPCCCSLCFTHLFLQVFEPFGPVELVQLPTDPETGQCKGFGFVQVSYMLNFCLWVLLVHSNLVALCSQWICSMRDLRMQGQPSRTLMESWSWQDGQSRFLLWLVWQVFISIHPSNFEKLMSVLVLPGLGVCCV